VSVRPGVTLRHRVVRCPFCGLANDAVTSINANEGPKDGDLSVCIGCYRFSVFTDGVTKLRPTNEEEDRALEADPELRRIAQVARIKRGN
jgi:hypothetical protein